MVTRPTLAVVPPRDTVPLGGAVADVARPDGNAPRGSAPDGNALVGNAPHGNAPDGSAPDGSAPDRSALGGNAQERDTPGGIKHDEAMRVRLGSAVTTPAEILLKLALDPSIMVRTALVLNPAAPPGVHGLLARDADERIRVLLAGKLAALAPRLTATERMRLNHQTVEALACLIEDAAVRVRAAIAEVVKEMPNVPHELVLRFARDTEVEVHGPVIRLSPLLTQADLLALLAASDAPQMALAVARRPGLTADVADAVAESADTAAIRAMLLNHSAQIRESTLDALIARAAEQITWHAPLVRRPNLSPRAADALSHIVADTLLAELATRTGLSPSIATELRARLIRRLHLAGTPPQIGPTPPDAPARTVGPAEAGIPIGAGASGTDTSGTDTSGTDTSGTRTSAACTRGAGILAPTDSRAPIDASARANIATPTDMLVDARARGAGGQLTETELLGVVGRGEARLAATMLSIAANVPLAVVERAATLGSAKGVVSLVWRAGFSMKIAVPLQSLLTRLAPGSLLRPGTAGGFPLAVEEMRWQIEFLGRGAVPAPPAQPGPLVSAA